MTKWLFSSTEAQDLIKTPAQVFNTMHRFVFVSGFRLIEKYCFVYDTLTLGILRNIDGSQFFPEACVRTDSESM